MKFTPANITRAPRGEFLSKISTEANPNVYHLINDKVFRPLNDLDSPIIRYIHLATMNIQGLVTPTSLPHPLNT